MQFDEHMCNFFGGFQLYCVLHGPSETAELLVKSFT